jgi:hypothetical protein
MRAARNKDTTTESRRAMDDCYVSERHVCGRVYNHTRVVVRTVQRISAAVKSKWRAAQDIDCFRKQYICTKQHQRFASLNGAF